MDVNNLSDSEAIEYLKDIEADYYINEDKNNNW